MVEGLVGVWIGLGVANVVGPALVSSVTSEANSMGFRSGFFFVSSV